MGATKRLAEGVCRKLVRVLHAGLSSVRFGNVLGSRGSVIPTFLRQIQDGGPVTVTHPDMVRYFMTIPEAVQLVLQAAVMGEGGEVFVLDMGEPIRVVDLATDMIRLSGLSPDDIEVRFTGVRPGEKLYEELFFNEENATRTEHPKVLRARNARLEFSGGPCGRRVDCTRARERSRRRTPAARSRRSCRSTPGVLDAPRVQCAPCSCPRLEPIDRE